MLRCRPNAWKSETGIAVVGRIGRDGALEGKKVACLKPKPDKEDLDPPYLLLI